MDTAPDKIALPFAESGGRRDIPIDSQILVTPGAASYTDGFPPLTRTPIAEGGVPPFGIDMNGILYALSSGVRWLNAGGGYPYDATFATAPEVAGYPAGARVMQSDASGYWINTIDGNDVDPESTTTGEAATSGWRPEFGTTSNIVVPDADVTMTPVQYGREVVIFTGALTGNRSIYFPDIAGKWAVVNNCTGNFSLVLRTQSGSEFVRLMPGKSEIVCVDADEIRVSTKSGIQSSGYSAETLSRTMDYADFGGTVVSEASGNIVLTLPSVAGVTPGVRTDFINSSSYNMTLSTSLSQSIVGLKGASGTSLVIPPGGNVTLECSQSANWRAVGGISGGQFKTVSNSNGYAFWIGETLIQVGNVTQAGQSTVTYSFPEIFPNQVFAMLAGKGSVISLTDEPACGVAPTSLSAFEISNSSATTADQLIAWVAVGR